MRIIGQYDKTFIVAEAQDSLILIDQHVAEERVNYEKFRNKKIKVQSLIDPIVVELEPKKYQSVIGNKKLLEELGFNFEKFGRQTLVVRTIPDLLEDKKVVEKQLAEEGKDRHAIGREAFIGRVWTWREESGGKIIEQLKRLGASCDWQRERFTMDEGLSRAVREVFVRLYDDGLIYRANRLINWCPRCHTALSDLEVEHEERQGHLWHLRYPITGTDRFLVVATTRPETLMGDTGVAVNPEDKRHRDQAGRRVLLPVLNKPIPVIFDSYVDVEFGTGALKITPAHDPNDFEIGNTHGLARIKVIDENGKMNEAAGPYQGMDRFECREKLVQDLQEEGLLEKVEPYGNAIGHCYRCKTMIEPLLSKQWFVKAGPLAESASKAVREDRTRIFPENWAGVYFEWMDNIRDWCISRQIWWGHRIPAWFCRECGKVAVARDTPAECPACGSTDLVQETDVLDTWFSSALWPFSTLGWPDETRELKTFYPTSVLVTGFDILFFWVARMMMMGCHFMGDVPFRHVYIHALVRDAEGQKMSKSKGNVIDPLEVMDRFGTDSFRFTLAALAVQGRDVKLSEERIQGYRHFINKIWNAARFVLMNQTEGGRRLRREGKDLLAERWIMTRLAETSEAVTRALDEYRFNEAAGLCYHFVWHEFCDWYLELVKQGLYGEDEGRKAAVREVLRGAFEAVLKLLHPFIPFVTEELWQKLPTTEGSIMIARFPRPSDFTRDEHAVEQMELLQGIITGVRNIRGEMNIPPSKKVSIVIDAAGETQANLLRENMAHIRTLARVDEVSVTEDGKKPEASATSVFGGNQVHVLLRGLLDFEEERKRLEKAIKKVDKDIGTAAGKLSNRGFLEKAPTEVVAEVKGKLEALNLKREKLSRNLSLLEAIDD